MTKRPKTTNGLHLSASLSLPIESVVETFAVLGKRGSGKTSTAVVMAEEMIGAGQPVVIVDPVGVWWGLRSSADGTGEGLPVVIFGGDHADVPLTEKAGAVVADAVMAGRFPTILDLSHLSKSAMRRFMTDFLERLYHRNREALHVIIDEADLLAPQRVPAEGLRLFGAMDDIQRRGRARGIGTTLITQRPAVINKDLLSQSEVLVCLRLTGVRDVAAIDEWVRLNADEDEAKTVKASLASLPVGTAWVWSPTLLGILDKVPVRRRHTFDSSATPKPGQPRPVAAAFAAVDTAALGAQIEALNEEAASSDPTALRAKVTLLERERARLEKNLARERAEREAATNLVTIPPDPVPVLTPEQERTLSEATERVREYAANAAQRAETAAADIKTQVAELAAMLTVMGDLVRTATAKPAKSPSPARTVRGTPRPTPQPSRPAPPQPRGSSDVATLPKANRLILTVLAQHGPRTINQVAILTAYSSKGGGFRNALSSLRSAGLITGVGTVEITDEGLHALGSYEPLPTGVALLDWWKSNPRIGKAERAILDVLYEAYPAECTIENIAVATDYSPAGGGFRNALSRLRSLELASGRAALRLSDQFFVEQA